MRHLKRGRKLSRRREHRRAMLANLAASLIKNGRVKTTDAKAKEIRPFVERMVTFARRGDLHARRIVLSRLKDSDAVKKLFDEIGPKFVDRFGGYTRILKLGFRPGDNSPVSLIEFVGSEIAKPPSKTKASKKKSKDAQKEAAATVKDEAIEAASTEEAEAVTADADAEAGTVEADEAIEASGTDGTVEKAEEAEETAAEEETADAGEDSESGKTDSVEADGQSDDEDKNGRV